MSRRDCLVVMLFIAVACGSGRPPLASDEVGVLASAASYINVPSGVESVIAERPEAYQPWLSETPGEINPALISLIEPITWRELFSQYALINQEIVSTSYRMKSRTNSDTAFEIAFSRPAFSSDRSLALLTYSTSWRGHGLVAAMVLRRRSGGWAHVGTVPLVGA